MNRRGFLGAFGALGAGLAMPVATKTAAPVVRAQNAAVPNVKPADGSRFIIGVATESVRAGDFVQIQTYGPCVVNVK